MATRGQRMDLEPIQAEPFADVRAQLEHARTEADAAQRQLDVANERERLLSEQVARLEKRLLEAETRVAEMEGEVRRRSELAEEMTRAISWRVTAPLRRVGELLRRT
jgi:chromosome segregation ATPase